MDMRPARTRPCPLADKIKGTGCDWNQITAWYVGSPHNIQDVPHDDLVREAVAHMETHYGPKRTWFV